MSRTAKTNTIRGPKVALALTTALASVALAGCTTSAAPRADASFSKAQIALTNGKTDKAVTHAEAAVLAEPRNAGYRALLGASYLEAGRFQAAATSFNDALELGDTDARTVLSYALAEIALGNHHVAISTLDEWQGDLDPADLGLALALAGQPDRGVHVLANALRAGENTAKMRQNLAYAYALQGNWRAARVMVAEDVPADQVSDRIGEWAQTARPEQFTQRVAGLLQVTPVSDSGQPTQLALANHPAHATMVAEAAAEQPVETPVAEAPQFAIADVVPAASPVAPMVAPEAPAAARKGKSFEEEFAAAEPKAIPAEKLTGKRIASNAVVQDLPVSYTPAKAKPAAVTGPRIAAGTSQRRMASSSAADGTHLVQLGSFSSRANAERAWGIYQNQYSELSDRDLVITKAKVRGKTYWRVAAAGFGASDAKNMCGTIKSRGNGCFAYAEGKPLPGALRGPARMAAR